ncbi:unnamed protein product [Closterium sp. NIES-53]
MASLRVLAFDHEGRPIQFDTWLDDLQLYLLSDSRDSVSLFDYTSGAAPAPLATADSATHPQWLTRDAAARLAIRNHLPLAECAHFGQYRLAQTLYDAVVTRYSSPATAALGRLLLPYLFPELSAFATVEDLVSHLRTSDARYRAAAPAEFLDRNQPPIFIALYFIVTRLPDSLRFVTDHFLALDPTVLTIDLLEQHLHAAETSVVAVGAARGTPRTLFFEGCSPSPLAPSYASAAAVDVLGAEDTGAAFASAKRRSSKGKGGRGGGGSGSGGGRAGATQRGGLGGGHVGRLGVVVAARVIRTGDRAGQTCKKPYTKHRCFSRLDDAWRAEFGDEAEHPRWAELLRPGVAIFDIDYDVILAAMDALFVSAKSDCYLCVPPDPGIEAAALGASESTLPGAAHAEALHTFTLDLGAARCFFRDSTTLTPLSTPKPVRLADPLGGPVVAHSSTVLQCLAVPSGSLSGLHLPSFSTNLDLPVLRLHSARGGEFSSNLLQEFCHGEGILQLFMLPASPQQNGIAERRIGLVMEVACTSMIHAGAPHFLWPFAVRYAAHQLNLWTHPLPGAVPVEVVGNSGATRGAAPEGAEPRGAEFEGVGYGGAEPGGAEPGVAEPGGAEAAGVEPGGVEPGGPAGASPRLSPRHKPLTLQQLREWFAQRTRLRSGAARAGDPAARDTGAGVARVTAGAGGTGGAAAAGSGGARTRGIGAAGTGGVGGAGAGDPTERGAAESGGVGAGGPGVVGARAGGAGDGGAGAGGAGVGGTSVGGAGAGGVGGVHLGAEGAGAGGTGAGGTVRPRPYFVPLLQQVLGVPSSTGLNPPLLRPQPDKSQPHLQPASPLPAPSPYSEKTGGLTERREPASHPTSPVRTACHVPHPRPPPVPSTHATALCPSSVPLRGPLPGGEFSSNLLREFCHGEGILQLFMLPASPQQNGIAERRIGLVMEVARTSMIHAGAPHFLWPFAVRYAAHQLNLWIRVSLPETSSTLHWTGEVGDASVFRRSGSGGGPRQQQQRSRATLSPQQLREWYAARQRGGGTGPCTYVLRTGDRAGEQCGGPHSTQRCFGRLTDAWRHQFPDATEIPRWGELTSGLGLVLGGRSPVVLTGHKDASWVDDQATQRSSQGYTFSLCSGSVSWRSTRSSSVLSSSCEAEIYAGAMAAQELRWLTYLLTSLGEPPRSPPVLYVDNKAMLPLCREQRVEHRTKHIALRYFLAHANDLL